MPKIAIAQEEADDGAVSRMQAALTRRERPPRNRAGCCLNRCAPGADSSGPPLATSGDLPSLRQIVFANQSRARGSVRLCR
jgi:hypothetical protein